MPVTVTPIRYPGGKTKIYPLVREIIQVNSLQGGTYVEPFAGGAGLALKLLARGDVEQIIINDADPAIYSIWHAIIFETRKLCDFISNVDVNIEEWKKQKEAYNNCCSEPSFELAKAAFFLNRTNISGVITGGPIGGLDQKGTYKIDARFTKSTLIQKIGAIAEEKQQIKLYNLDVLDFMQEILPSLEEKSLVYFDPPYVKKGSQLYKNAFSDNDHIRLKEKITSYERNWIVTYDVCELINNLYSNYRGRYIDVRYSANGTKKAREYIFFSKRLKIPERLDMNEPTL